MSSKHSGIAIALAWPDTFCKQARAWYDLPMRWLRFNIDYYYQAGHAAVLLIQKGGDKCHYFDFGRYHAPYGNGRVRGANTDPELDVHTKPEFNTKGKEILNIQNILFELQTKSCYHGDGRLYASHFQIDFQKALKKAIELQAREFITYGPFVWGGTNCSRFVSSVIAAGSPPTLNLLRLKLLIPVTPTTMSNVYAGYNSVSVPKLSASGKKVEVLRPNYREWASDSGWLSAAFPQPERHYSIPTDAQWLSGEGYGSWFHLQKTDEGILLSKFSPKGEVEHRTRFICNHSHINLEKPYTITYPTNNRKITIIQDGVEYLFDKTIPIIECSTKQNVTYERLL